MRGKSNFYKHLVRIFWLSLIVGTVGIWYYVDRSIPDRVSVTEHDQEEFTFSLPWRATVYSESEEVALGNKSNIPAEQITINSREPFSMYAGKKGSYQLDLKLFGVIQFKNIQVDVVDTTRLIPCGSPVGIYLKSKGIMVIGTGRITGENGMEMEPAVGKLKSGDYIEAFNGQKLGTKEELAEAVSHFQGENVTLTVRRNGAETQVEIQRIDMTGNKKNKSLVIKITDPELLNLTGGIIQGTSGSPVIQNGKIIGAITHVFVQDPTRGYGILIEDMLGH